MSRNTEVINVGSRMAEKGGKRGLKSEGGKNREILERD